ncbi:MAG: GC-type dockerin domain-anchored protein, partial [Planctomycetota bacterium]|nr:GC-type dockerin domain-anchored protein [Planctomycetota bacterium]
QSLDWIPRGGSFAFAHVAEPFTAFIVDLETFADNFYLRGLSFAEAAYSALPALSWQNVPIGDPLAVVMTDPANGADLTGDGRVNAADLANLLGAWGTDSCIADLSGDGIVTAADLGILLGSWQP